MTKDAEHQQAFQRPLYPTQMPSAPPSYDEAMYNPQANPPHSSQTNASVYNQPNQQTAGAYMPSNQPAGGYMPNAGTYVQPPIVEIQRTVIALPLGPNPARIKCPNCHFDVQTAIECEPSCAAHLCCLLLLLIGCCPFSSLPYCMESLKNVRHSCPNCNVFLGSYQP